jgi:hypothetical protein
LNPDYKFEIEGEEPFTFYLLKERFLLWWFEFMENFRYFCKTFCNNDQSFLKRKKKTLQDLENELFDETVKPDFKDDIDLEVEEVKNTILKINQ